MKKIILLFIVFSYITLFHNALFGQSHIHEMLRKTLNEKSFLKLSIPKDINSENIKKNNFTSREEIFEKLVGDDSDGIESELFAAINPKDSSKMVVSSINFGQSILQNPLQISTYYSEDFGETWTKSSFTGVESVNGLIAGGGDPVLTFDSNGRLHLTYIILEVTNIFAAKAKEYIFHATSMDNGKTWISKPYFASKEFNASDYSGLDNFLDKQWMVSDVSDSSPYKGNTYMCNVNFNFKDTESPTATIELGVMHGYDADFIYAPVPVSGDTFTTVQFSSIDVDIQGNVYVGFIGSYDDRTFYYFISTSTDGGKSFGTPNKITDFIMSGYTEGSDVANITGVDNDRYYPCPYIAVDKSLSSHSGRIYASWTCSGIDTVANTSFDIYLSYSDDQSKTWSKPQIVNNDNLDNSQQFYSSIDVNLSGIPILTFYDKRTDPEQNAQTDYYLAYPTTSDISKFDLQYPVNKLSTDFSKIGSQNSNFGIGEYNKTISTKGFAIPFWADGRENDGDIRIMMAKLPLDGKKHTSAVHEIKMITDKIKITSISPNPAMSEIKATISLKNTTYLKYRILNIDGMIESEGNLGIHNEGNNEIRLNTNNLKTGSYILILGNENYYVNSKFTVVK